MRDVPGKPVSQMCAAEETYVTPGQKAFEKRAYRHRGLVWDDLDAEQKESWEIQGFEEDEAAENLRIERWHATYNAALTGLLAGAGNGDGRPSTYDSIENAGLVADEIHGRRKKMRFDDLL